MNEQNDVVELFLCKITGLTEDGKRFQFYRERIGKYMFSLKPEYDDNFILEKVMSFKMPFSLAYMSMSGYVGSIKKIIMDMEDANNRQKNIARNIEIRKKIIKTLERKFIEQSGGDKE